MLKQAPTVVLAVDSKDLNRARKWYAAVPTDYSCGLCWSDDLFEHPG